MAVNSAQLIEEIELYTNMEDYIKLKRCSEKIFKKCILKKVNLSEFTLCLEEIFTNALFHGYKGESGVINVRYIKDEEYLIVKIRDFGTGICKKCINFNMPADVLAMSGRGLFIVKSLSYNLLIERCSSGGTEVTIYFER